MSRQNKKDKKIGGIILAILIILLIIIIGFTYSRYLSRGTANANVQIAKWQIKLNGQDMSTVPVTKDVELNFVDNEYVKDDRIAPGRKVTFDVVLDPTGSEVAIDYILNFDVSSITGMTNANSKISVTSVKYKIGNDGAITNATINNDEVIISESLVDVEANKVVTATLTLEWDNDSDNLSSDDTENGATAGVITLPVTVTAEQHI